jgi:hypothetical protein
MRTCIQAWLTSVFENPFQGKNQSRKERRGQHIPRVPRHDDRLSKGGLFAAEDADAAAVGIHDPVLDLVALALGGLGVFDVLAYAVSQRTYEVGVRMAMGATGGQVARMCVGHGAWLCSAGIAVGLALTLPIAPIIQRGLYQTSGRDPLTLTALSAFLFGIGLLASYVPARRAARLDPARTLRQT